MRQENQSVKSPPTARKSRTLTVRVRRTQFTLCAPSKSLHRGSVLRVDAVDYGSAGRCTNVKEGNPHLQSISQRGAWMYKRQWMKHIPGKSVYNVCHYCLYKCLCYCLHDCRTCPTPHLRRCALGYGLEKIQRHLELDLIRSRLAAARDCLSKPHVRPELKQHNCKSKR